ncbi:MAG: sodium:proton antiporter [Nitrospiraceae bacterium]
MTFWFIIVGLLLIAMALAGSMVQRLPFTASMLYLAVGIALGPHSYGLIQLDPLTDASLVERLTEVAVIISLFTAGLKLSVPIGDPRWLLTIRLAFGSMVLTVGLVAVAGMVVVGLPLGAALLLGAILAPTDPVLASDVQVQHAEDHDPLRFALTGEAGLNDGTAFLFVMLGLGLLGLHDLGTSGWRWVAVDLIWATASGLSIGAVLGTMVARLILYLRRVYQEAVGREEFLALGLVALSYGVALLASAYGFLAVFAAGVALRRIEREASKGISLTDIHDVSRRAERATHPEKGPAYMAQAVLGFNEQLERVGEVVVVLLLGAMLSLGDVSAALWLALLLLVVIRPLSVALGLLGVPPTRVQKSLIAWFGIRGIGSIYYLMYAIQHGVSGALAQELTQLTLTVVAVSILIHGISVMPLIKQYEKQMERRTQAGA